MKRAWDNDLAFERASRSLAKTGSSWRSKMVKNPSRFLVFSLFRALQERPEALNARLAVV